MININKIIIIVMEFSLALIINKLILNFIIIKFKITNLRTIKLIRIALAFIIFIIKICNPLFLIKY